MGPCPTRLPVYFKAVRSKCVFSFPLDMEVGSLQKRPICP